jgi:hypothetical protein
MKRFFLFVFFLFAASATVSLQAKDRFDVFRLQFIDEAERDPSFLEFRKKFLDMVGLRNPRSLLALVDEKISRSFARKWNLDGDSDSARESQVWEKLRDTLNLGGSFLDGVFVAPFVFANWPTRYAQLDYLAVISRKAVLREKALESSRALETLSMEIVGRYDELPDPPGWRAVRTAKGNVGFLKNEECRSPTDYRARFTRIKGAWKLTSFSAGDLNRE